MPYEVTLKHLPAGVASSTADENEMVDIVERAFVTDANGIFFYKCLEGFESPYLTPFLQSGGVVSTIDHCLILLDKTKKATVYVNELQIGLEIIPKRDIKKGETVNKLDIAGLRKLFLTDISIPEDNGIIFYFSVGWKRGFFFDFRPLRDPNVKLENIDRTLATYFEYLLFNEIYSIEESLWDQVYSLGWFPFISIIDQKFERLLDRIGDNRPIEKTEQSIIESFDENKLNQILTRLEKQSFLKQHIAFIRVGIERYLDGDYISAINNIWPRVEGILQLAFTNKKKSLNQDALLENMSEVVANDLVSPSIFFPQQFRDYLRKFYFKNYSIKNKQFSVSRHSIGHGVSDASEYDQKRALLGILMVDQLSYYLALDKGQSY